MSERSSLSPARRRLAGLWLPAATLTILAAACFARLIADPTGLIVDGRHPSIDYANRGDLRPVGNDLTFLFLPHHQSIAERIERFGHRPAWDARGFGGRPMAGNPQAGMSYPPAWIAWRWRAPSVLGWLTVAHLVWGGFGTYVLVRSLGARRWPATISAGIYQASPYLLAHTFEGHYPHVWAACWYPWAFWAFRTHQQGRTRGLWLAPILALTYLTGHPQEWLLLVAALSAWAAVDAIQGWRSRGPRWAATRLAGSLAALTLSVGLAAVDVAPQSFARPLLRQSHDPGNDGIPRRYHLGGLNAYQLLSPFALGAPADYFGDDNYWESVASIGLVPFVLAIVAVSRDPDRRRIRGWAWLALLAIAFALGRSAGLYTLCYQVIPGAGSIRVPARSLFLANLAGAVLAGFGVETLRGRMAERADWGRFARRIGVAAVVLVVLLQVIRIGRPSSPARPQNATGSSLSAPPAPPASGRTAMAAAHVLGDPRFWIALGGTAMLLAAGCLRVPASRRRRIAGLIGLVALVELGWYGFALIRVSPSGRFVGPDPIGIALARLTDEDPSAGPRPSVRIKARDSFYGDLRAVAHGIEKTNVNDTFQLDRAAALYETLYPVASRVRPMTERLLSPPAKQAWRRIRQAVFDRMSVWFLVSDRAESDPPWPVAAEGMWDGSRFVIQRNPLAMPRAYVVPRATVLPDHPGVVLTSLVGIDPRRSVVMAADPLADIPPVRRQPFTPAEWTSVDPDRPSLLVTTRSPGLLVVADSWTPGWTAAVDGRPAPVLIGNHAQRVIPLPHAGRHMITMKYDPPGRLVGWAVSMASALVWAGIVARRTLAPSGAPIKLRGPHVILRGAVVSIRSGSTAQPPD